MVMGVVGGVVGVRGVAMPRSGVFRDVVRA